MFVKGGGESKRCAMTNIPSCLYLLLSSDSDNCNRRSSRSQSGHQPPQRDYEECKTGKNRGDFSCQPGGFYAHGVKVCRRAEKYGLIQQRTALELRYKSTYRKAYYGAQKCLSGKDGYNAEGYKNYDGRQVLGAWCWIAEHDCGFLRRLLSRRVMGQHTV